MFATERMMSVGGKIWLPNIPAVASQLMEFDSILSLYFEKYWIEDGDMSLNPLYRATEGVEDLLGDLPDGRTNATQMVPYLEYSDHPFVVLHIKPAYATHIVMIDVEQF